MFFDGTHLGGMHFFWWLFWIVAFVSFFSVLTPVPRHRAKRLHETPRDTILRRFSEGEIDEQEYERRKTIIDRDSRQETTPKQKGSLVGVSGRPLAN